MKTLVDTQIKEANGATLEARIYYSDEGNRYSVTYQMNGETIKTEEYPNKNMFFVEDAVSNWFSGVKKLNG